MAQVATGGGTAARQADASASGAMTVRRIRGHGVGVEMGEKKNGRRAAFVKVAGGKEKKETSSHGMDNDGEGGRGGGGIVQAMKGLSVWNMLRERERQRDPASEKTSEASSSEQEEPKSDGAKAKVDKCIGEYGKEERCVDRSMQRICDATKRRLEGVRKRLAGEQDMPERFVLKKGEGRVREPLSGEGRDAPDCSNDKYFQELMNSEA